MPTTRASSRMWIPGIEEIASKMRPRTPVPPAAKPSLPEEGGHADQEEDRNLEARDHELARPSAPQEAEHRKDDSNPFPEGESQAAREEAQRLGATARERRGNNG